MEPVTSTLQQPSQLTFQDNQELLTIILEYLKPEDTPQLRLVCKQWRELIVTTPSLIAVWGRCFQLEKPQALLIDFTGKAEIKSYRSRLEMDMQKDGLELNDLEMDDLKLDDLGVDILYEKKYVHPFRATCPPSQNSISRDPIQYPTNTKFIVRKVNDLVVSLKVDYVKGIRDFYLDLTSDITLKGKPAWIADPSLPKMESDEKIQKILDDPKRRFDFRDYRCIANRFGMIVEGKEYYSGSDVIHVWRPQWNVFDLIARPPKTGRGTTTFPFSWILNYYDDPIVYYGNDEFTIVNFTRGTSDDICYPYINGEPAKIIRQEESFKPIGQYCPTDDERLLQKYSEE